MIRNSKNIEILKTQSRFQNQNQFVSNGKLFDSLVHRINVSALTLFLDNIMIIFLWKENQ